jgi:hypothetical protein
VTNEALFELIKETALKVAEREHPGDEKSMEALRARISERLILDAPLSELGWDSARMTWLLVRLEERLNIDVYVAHATINSSIKSLRAASTPTPWVSHHASQDDYAVVISA